MCSGPVYSLLSSSSVSMSPLQDKGFLHSHLSDACVFQAAPTKLPISSLHLVLYLPCLLLPSLDCHSVTLTVYRLSLRVMMYPAHVHIFLLIVLKISSTLVCSLIHDAFFLALHVMPSIILSIPLWALWSFRSRPF